MSTSFPSRPAVAGLLNRGAPDQPDIDWRATTARVVQQAKDGDVSTGGAGARDDIGFALQAIEATLYALDDIRARIEEACEVALAAREAEDEAGRALLAERYDDLRLQIEPLAEGAEYEGVNLLGRRATSLDDECGGRARYCVFAARLNLGEKSLHLPPPRDAFGPLEEVDAIIDRLDRALSRMDRIEEIYCRDAQALSLRLTGATAA